MTGENEGWPTAQIGDNGGPSWPTAEVEAPPVETFEILYVGQPATEHPEHFRMRRNAEIEHWQAAKPVLEAAKTNEMDLRKQVAATLFPNPVKGTQRYALGGGYNIKLVYGLTYTLGNKDKLDPDSGKKIPIRHQIEILETQIIEKHGEAGEQLLKRLISWKPELSGSEYEKLDDNNPIELEVRNMIDEHLTIKPASPTMEFEEPK